MGRHESADTLAELLIKLGWARDKTEDVDVGGQDDANGVTVISHSKYVLRVPSFDTEPERCFAADRSCTPGY